VQPERNAPAQLTAVNPELDSVAMNAERLHAVARALRDDLDRNEIPQLMGQLAGVLASSVQDPTNSDLSRQIGEAREQVVDKLRVSKTNEFPDSWLLALKELGVDDLVGMNLLWRIEEIFARNEITISTASDEIGEINTRIQELSATLNQLIGAFEAFGIGSEKLGPGEFEVGILIPRAAVDNELEELGKEFTKLDSILGPFAELNGENRPTFKSDPLPRRTSRSSS